MAIMFRESAKHNNRSAKRVDKDIRLVSVRMWILLIVSALWIGGLLAWGFFGRVPITTDVIGVYTYSLGKIQFRADKSGTINAVVCPQAYLYEGSHICALTNGQKIDSAVECTITDVYVQKGDWVDKGDMLCSGSVVPSDGVYVERAYLYVPYDQTYLFDGNLPVQLDAVGISEDSTLLKGFLSSESTDNVVTREDVERKYGKELVEDIITDNKPWVELRCSPMGRGSKEHFFYSEEEDQTLEYMEWRDKLNENGYDAFPDFTLVKGTVTLEYRRPITLLIPALESVFKPIPAGYDREELDDQRPYEPNGDDITWLLLDTLKD